MKKKFFFFCTSSFGTVGYDGSFLKGYKHLVVMGSDGRHVTLTASPPQTAAAATAATSAAAPQAPAFVDFFNTLKLSIESVAWTSSFFVVAGL